MNQGQLNQDPTSQGQYTHGPSHKLHSKVRQLLSMLLLGLISTQANAQWQIDSAGSTLSFVSIKAGNIAEVHTFKSLSGSVSKTGEVELTIDPTSVDTLIPIRDERMQKILFEADVFPKISLSASVPEQLLSLNQKAAPTKHSLTGTLTVRDRSTDVATDVLIIQSNQQIVVTSLAPVLLNAASLGLDTGIEKLREIAGLPSISQAVPVTFTFVFNAQE